MGPSILCMLLWGDACCGCLSVGGSNCGYCFGERGGGSGGGGISGAFILRKLISGRTSWWCEAGTSPFVGRLNCRFCGSSGNAGCGMSGGGVDVTAAPTPGTLPLDCGSSSFNCKCACRRKP